MGRWTEKNGIRTFPFYLRVLYEYVKHFGDFKDVNVLTQMSWVITFKGKRYDLLTDFNFISKILVFILSKLFDIVQISYTKEEIKEIVRNHPHADSEEKIGNCIKNW